jgi:multimeric flavodoxin WrbA
MKVLLLNGSPRREGNTHIALAEVAKGLAEFEIETIPVWIGNDAVRGCIACDKCKTLGKCVFTDDLYEKIREYIDQADGYVIGSPVYYAGPNGSLCALLDRVFRSCSKQMEFKPAASVAVCRRGGASTTFDRLNKYFTINNMPIVSSLYWNSVHGMDKGEATQDAEGLQTMRVLGRNMGWLLKSIHQSNIAKPPAEIKIKTNMIK